MKPYCKMKILVTGGNGFIGHTLVRQLLNDGNQVKVIDIKPVKFTHPKLEFVKKSVLDDIRWEMRDCDMVYHLAAELGVINSDKKPLNTLAVNIDGAERSSNKGRQPEKPRKHLWCF